MNPSLWLRSGRGKPIWHRLLAALVIVAVASGLRVLLFPDMGRAVPYLLYFPATMLAALYGGTSAGLLAILVSATLVYFWNLHGVTSHSEFLALLTFIISSILLSLVARSMRLAENREQLALAKAEIVTEELRHELAERRQTEAANARLAAIVDSSEDAIIGKSTEGIITSWNRGAEKVFGYTSAEMIGVSILQLIPAERHAEEKVFLEQIQRGEAVEHFETVRLTKSGRLIDVSVTVSPIRDADGKIVGVSKVARDITARKQAEALLIASQERYGALFDRSLDCVFLHDFAGNFIDANQSALDLLGYQHEEIGGLNFARVVAEYQLPLAFQTLEEIRITGRQKQPVEFRVRAKDGRLIDVQVQSSLIYRDGQPFAIQGIARDLTQRKQADELLRSSEKRYRALLDNLEAAVVVHAPDTSVILSNSRALELLGLTEGQIKGRLALDPEWKFLHEDLSPLLPPEYPVNQVKAGRKAIKDLCLGIVRPGNKDIAWVNVSGVPIFDSQGEIREIIISFVDITERKRMDSALRESEIKLRKIFECSRDSIAISKKGIHVFANPAYLKMFGYESNEQIIGTKIVNHIAPSHRAQMIANIELRAAGEFVPTFYETLGVSTDGHEFDLEVSVSTYKVQDEIFTLATLRDITESKRMEAALRESERLNHATLDALASQVAVLDECGKIIAVNHAWRAFAQANACDWRAVCEGANYLKACDEAAKCDPDAALVAKGIREVMADAQRTWFHEYPCHSATEERWFFCRFTRFPGDGPVRLVVAHENITKLKRVEAAHHRLALAVEQAAETIVITDLHGKILYANPAFEKTSGYTRAEAIGQNPRILKSGKQDAKFYRQMWEVLQGGNVWHGHFSNRRKDGTVYEEEATISPVRDAAGKVISFVAVKHDVTRELQLESQQRQTQKMEAIGTLAGGVAHDFNNLLQVLSMEAGLLKHSGGLTPEQMKYADQINATVDRAAALTRQLLLFSRHEAAHPRDLDLSESVTTTTKMLRRILGEDIELQVKLAPQPLFIHADAGMMDQVLMNLVVNARDAMPKGGRLTIATAGVDFDESTAAQSPPARTGAFVCLSVSDTGTGISPEVLPKIFEPFFTTKDIGKGTGLGLATAFGIVSQHHGWINVASEVGQGTTFQVYLPRLVGMSNQTIAQKLMTSLPTGKETILLVEDEPALRNTVRNMLTKLGYHVLEAPTGVLALEVWRQHAPEIHLMLTDLMMPDGLNGVELGQRLLQENPRLKIIYMSGYSADNIIKDSAMKEGVNFLSKPFQTHKLAQIIRDTLDRPA